ncbi:Bgt-994 [Blumeria graminis f. sp. tritici]|uniref:Uncharacterized protein n=3 Tax=Blumeria graminis f. sp. tritici TaxID=62690 RepID=A0A656KIS5_BLUGR|nr:hypothetical protein BGT96224_994 [Blumeria graminis f. sp. tritici 96224]VCU40141.1 Bgt-994 [Blumeria graminis f. sp. tritici]
MSQGVVGATPVDQAVLTTEELREMLEYERIIQFRDAVISGSHPRIKIPSAQTEMRSKNLKSIETNSQSAPQANPNNSGIGESPNITTNTHDPIHSGNKTNDVQNIPSLKTTKPEKPEIKPVLPEKPKDLVKARLQLERQRLEGSLKDQVEQQRKNAKVLLQKAESLPDFDISEVLTKALSIVQPSISIEEEPSGGARSLDSRSLDDNTFYSSQQDTPELTNSPKVSKVDEQKCPAPDSAFASFTDQSKAEASTTNGKDKSPPELMQEKNSHRRSSLQAPSKEKEKLPETGLPGSVNPRINVSKEKEPKIIEAKKLVETATSKPMATKTKLSMTSFTKSSCEGSPEKNFSSGVASIPAHHQNLSPAVSLSTRVSPMTTTKDQAARRKTVIDDGNRTQNNIPRQLQGISSAESSPKGRNSDKKKDKKKRRRVKNVGSPDPTYIKPEPRSPSPLAPMARPPKRQRAQYASDLNYYESPSGSYAMEPGRTKDQYQTSWRPRYYEQETTRVASDYELRHRQILDEDYARRETGRSYTQWAHSPQPAPIYPQVESRSRAVSSATVRRLNEDDRPLRESNMRASVRPDVDRDRSRSPYRENIPMGPPRPPVRIMVDEYGRQYFNPSTPSLRQSIAPSIRYQDDLMYERLPARSVSSRIPMVPYDEESIVVRRASPTFFAPRRVITQPEYYPVHPGYRPYRQREYSVHPAAIAPPGDEYPSYRYPPEHLSMSQYEEPSRENLRAATVRPEVIRYEGPAGYQERMSSVRPENPPRRSEGRRDMIPQVQREYSVRPTDTGPRETFPDDRYYEEPPVRQLRRPESIILQGDSDYYEPTVRRSINEMRAAEASRYEDRYSRRDTDVRFPEEARARDPSVFAYPDEITRSAYR